MGRRFFVANLFVDDCSVVRPSAGLFLAPVAPASRRFPSGKARNGQSAEHEDRRLRERLVPVGADCAGSGVSAWILPTILGGTACWGLVIFALF